MCQVGHRPIISAINNNKLPSLISLSRDPIFGVQDERKLSTINNKALNYKRSPLRRSGKRGAAICKARIFPYRLKKMPTLTHFSCFRVMLQKQKSRFFLFKTASLADGGCLGLHSYDCPECAGARNGCFFCFQATSVTQGRSHSFINHNRTKERAPRAFHFVYGSNGAGAQAK